MISHKHKCIFVHIPKTAGTSINSYFHPGVQFHYNNPDYDRLFGWCPKRRIHMQHATSKELLELELVTEEQWNGYFKFTFVRNPWDRSFSDYFWIQKFSGVQGSFEDYLQKKGPFNYILNNNSSSAYLGDHLRKQVEYFDEEDFKLDFVGRFENLEKDVLKIINRLGLAQIFQHHSNKGKKPVEHYSNFYQNKSKEMVGLMYQEDIERFGYTYQSQGLRERFLRFMIGK